MPNPIASPWNNTQGDAVAGQVHAIGLRQLARNASSTSDPNWVTTLMSQWSRSWDLLLKAVGGAVVQFASSGLTVDVYAADYRIGATRYSYAGGTILLGASNTHYLYLDADQTIKSTTGDFPANVFRLAIVTTDATTATSIKDARTENFRIGETEWWTVAAGANVDLDGFDLLNAGRITFEAPSTLTIASGVITPTTTVHSVDTEGGAAADDVTTITADATNWPRLLILRNVNGAHQVTIAAGGNIDFLPDQAGKLIGTTSHALLLQYSATRWILLNHPQVSISTMLGDIQGANMAIIGLGMIELTVEDEQIASGAIDATDRQEVRVDTEGGAASDDLTTMTGGDVGRLVTLKTLNAGRAVTVKHGTGANQFRLSYGRDFLMNTISHTLVVRMGDDGVWAEVTRSHWTNSVPKDWVVFAAGTPSVSGSGYGEQFVARNAGVITYASGKCRTAPGAGGCIVDVRINGNSIFAAQAQMVNIASGATFDASDVKNAVYAPGDVIDIEFEAVNAAADITTTIHCQESPQATP